MAIDLEAIEAYPLHWPTAWPRLGCKDFSRFGNHSLMKAVGMVLEELRRMGVKDYNVLISSNVRLRRDGLPYSNQAQPDDAGIAVYFRLKGTPTVLACDRWRTVEHNLWAIGKHIEALRGQDRWGVGNLEQAFRGYQMLEATAGGPVWWKVLGLDGPVTDGETLRAAFRVKAKECHPDQGGDRAEWDALERAYRQGREQGA